MSKSTTKVLKQYLTRYESEIATALPKHLDARNMIRMALTEASTNKELAGCDPRSFFGAVIECSQLGLAIGKTMGQAYLIPFNNTRENTKTINVIMGYRGMISLARRSGNLHSIGAHIVFEGDEFQYLLGDDEKIIHVPKGEYDPERKVVAYYCIARLNDGGIQRAVWSEAQMQKHKERIPAAKSSRSVWNSPIAHDRQEMGKKSMIRAALKYVDLSADYIKAVTLEATADDNRDQGLARNVLVGDYKEIDDEPEQDEPKEKVSRTRQLKQELQTANQDGDEQQGKQLSEYDEALLKARKKIEGSASTKALKENTDAALNEFPNEREIITKTRGDRFEELTTE